MNFILIPHVLNGQNSWKRPKRAPKLGKVIPFPMLETSPTAQHEAPKQRKVNE